MTAEPASKDACLHAPSPFRARFHASRHGGPRVPRSRSLVLARSPSPRSRGGGALPPKSATNAPVSTFPRARSRCDKTMMRQLRNPDACSMTKIESELLKIYPEPRDLPTQRFAQLASQTIFGNLGRPVVHRMSALSTTGLWFWGRRQGGFVGLFEMFFGQVLVNFEVRATLGQF